MKPTITFVKPKSKNRVGDLAVGEFYTTPENGLYMIRLPAGQNDNVLVVVSADDGGAPVGGTFSLPSNTEIIPAKVKIEVTPC